MLVEACGDAADLPALAEEPPDQIASPAEVGRNGASQTDPALGRDMGLAAPRRHPLHQGEAVMPAESVPWRIRSGFQMKPGPPSGRIRRAACRANRVWDDRRIFLGMLSLSVV